MCGSKAMTPQLKIPIESRSRLMVDNVSWKCMFAALVVWRIATDVSLTVLTLELFERLDTAGTEQFTAMRELYMKQGQGFLLVFSITSMSSLNELSELREQIIRIKDDENVPIVIVGNKSDLEEDRAVPRARAFALSQSWGNAPYYETSARRRANVNEVFIDLCRQIIRKDMQGNSISGSDNSARKREGAGRYDKKKEKKRRKGPCVIL
ncbi:hypothetical protein CDV55_101733 [Aspergillus turcosus]|nr:hypothetical protein CDV55_101733 [Aspergillus turcosus]